MKPRSAQFVVWVSGLLGFLVGSIGHPTWQVAVESAQVVAGIVEYPAENPFYMYHTALWTVLHQAGALFLWLGLPERWICFVFSGLLGMVSFQALALCVFCLSRDAVLSTLSPTFIHLTGTTQFGSVYPVLLLGTTHTYGVLGMSWMLLVLGLMGCGQRRAGAVLLGMAPMIHPSLGIWLWIIAGAVMVFDVRELRVMIAETWKWFLAGLSLSVVSFAYHMLVTYDVPAIASEQSARYLDAFVHLWDAHRQPVDPRIGSVYLTVGGCGVGLLWLTCFRRFVPSEARFLLRALVVAAGLALFASALSWLPPEALPSSLLVAMPTRLLNLNALAFVAVLLGLLGCQGEHVGARVVLALIVILLWLFSQVMMLKLMALAGVALLLLAWHQKHGSPQRWQSPIWTRRLRWIAVGIMVVVLAQVAFRTLSAWPSRWNALADYSSDPVFQEASTRKELLATGADLHLIQLRTRRPVLLDGGALDILPYALAGGPSTERILQDVYGIDLFDPPKEARRTSVIPAGFTKKIWEERSEAEWVALGRDFGFTDVLTYAEWTLKLPEVIQSEQLRLYRIPADRSSTGPAAFGAWKNPLFPQ